MKTFVIAMECEAKCVADNLENRTDETLYGRHVISGELNGEPTTVVVSGIGKSNAAAATQLAIQLTGSKTVLNLGVAGGLNPEMNVGDIYEVKDAVQYDFDLVQINGTSIGTLNERKNPFIPCKTVGRFPAKRLGTGDRFNDSEDDNHLLNEMDAELRDMEGAAMAHVCETAGVEFVSFKCVSDIYGSGATADQYHENLKRCLAILTDFAKSL